MMVLAALRAWFEGSPVAELGSATPAVRLEPEGAATDSSEQPDAAWPPPRLELTDRLWGEGFVFPGGAEETLRFAKRLGVSDATSLLLLGCGPGGAALCIATRLGAWVNGLEANPALAATGTSLCARTDSGRRAHVERWNAADPRLTPRSYHHALAFEAMRDSAPETVLGTMALALRRDGQLVLVEVVATPALDRRSPAFAAWMRMERRTAPPPTAALITKLFSRLGFAAGAAEDISNRHMMQVVRGWHEALRGFAARKPSSAQAAVIVREAELWRLRVGLMHAGQIRLFYWHAIRRVASGVPPV